MKDEIEKAIKKLAEGVASCDKNADVALKLSQAALNLAHARAVIADTNKNS